MTSQLIIWLLVGSGICSIWWAATRLRNTEVDKRATIAAAIIGVVCIALGIWLSAGTVGDTGHVLRKVASHRLFTFAVGVYALLSAIQSIINRGGDPNRYARFVRRNAIPVFIIGGITLILISLFGE